MTTLKQRIPNLRTKKLADRRIAYYWEVPTKDRRAGCTLANEALGRDPLKAMARAEELNTLLNQWRRRGPDTQTGPAKGSVAWLFSKVAAHPVVLKKRAKTVRAYRQGFGLIENHILASGRRFGDMPASAVDVRHLVRLYYDLLYVNETDPETGETRQRERRAMVESAMRAARRAWNIGMAEKWVKPPTENLFSQAAKLRGRDPIAEADAHSAYTPTRADLNKFIAKADTMGYPSMGTAALLAFELCQRENDVIGSPDSPANCGLLWAGYQSAEAVGRRRASIKIRQSKTGQRVEIPLFDEEGELFPGLIARLDKTPVRGPLIIMRDRLDRRTEQYLPYKEDNFRHVFRRIANAAKLPKDMLFMRLRHGGLTELSRAAATVPELTSHGGHKGLGALGRYLTQTGGQARNAARKRRILRDFDAVEERELAEKAKAWEQ